MQEEKPVMLGARACCSLCAVKEFLVVATLFLMLCDLADIYSNIIRVTGTELLPFPGNHTEFYYTAVPELNYYDMGSTVYDLASVLVLLLSGERFAGNTELSPRASLTRACIFTPLAPLPPFFFQSAPTRLTASSAACAALRRRCSSSLSTCCGCASRRSLNLRVVFSSKDLQSSPVTDAWPPPAQIRPP